MKQKIPKKRLMMLLAMFLALISCTPNGETPPAWSDLPQVTPLEQLKQTDFVPTLENPIPDGNRNAIYAPSFLFAWDKVEEFWGSEAVASDSNSLSFRLLTLSTSHQNSLNKDEFNTSVELRGDAVIARAFFNKTLPFTTKLQVLDAPILFDSAKVAAFGMQHFELDVVQQARILYYKDDEDFILQLLPEDKQHEIILAKGLGHYSSLQQGLELANDRAEKGRKEQAQTKYAWKYVWREEDRFAIPSIKFNIETHYKDLEGQRFIAKDGKPHHIFLAYQRTGFILNENGAVVESEAAAATDSIGEEPIKIHPKRMVFDKPFFVILKRSGQPNPYFVMRVGSAELLTKW